MELGDVRVGDQSVPTYLYLQEQTIYILHFNIGRHFFSEAGLKIIRAIYYCTKIDLCQNRKKEGMEKIKIIVVSLNAMYCWLYAPMRDILIEESPTLAGFSGSRTS